ncbi:uncharacterized protein DFL_001711 [Arthrobotrys flagrans]|uniref:Uncharacterized protein n=1 Tax=Arthrobotrys flagrans TaxID=97331 RepID=A0A437A974_ARTFL|nr:hypothetical protein DFL_001711 [Arthrobotrys flagrans]
MKSLVVFFVALRLTTALPIPAQVDANAATPSDSGAIMVDGKLIAVGPIDFEGLGTSIVGVDTQSITDPCCFQPEKNRSPSRGVQSCPKDFPILVEGKPVEDTPLVLAGPILGDKVGTLPHFPQTLKSLEELGKRLEETPPLVRT